MNEILIGSLRIARFNKDTEFQCLSKFNIEIIKITEISLMARDLSINLVFRAFRTLETEVDSIEDNNK
jgi:hypothetical protein